MISGIVDYRKNRESYLSCDTVFVNRNIVFYSDEPKYLTVTGKYIILSNKDGASAIYSKKDKNTTLSCRTSSAVLYYTFIGTAMIFSSDIENMIQKSCIILSCKNDIPSYRFLCESLKNIIYIPPFGHISYSEKNGFANY